MTKRITKTKLYSMFFEREGQENRNKLNKDNYTLEEPIIIYDKEDKSIKFDFYFEKKINDNIEDVFNIIIELEGKYLGKERIRVALLGSEPGVVIKEIDNDFDSFFKTFVMLRDEYIEYKGEFKESCIERTESSKRFKEKKEKEMEDMKNSLDFYLNKGVEHEN